MENIHIQESRLKVATKISQVSRTLSTLAYSRCPHLPVFNNRRLSVLCLSRIFMSRIFHPLQHCATVSVSRSFPPPAFWDILVPLFPFPLFHVSHLQRPQPTVNFKNCSRACVSLCTTVIQNTTQNF